MRFYEAAQRAGMIRSIRDIHWDVRPRPDFGSLEIRIFDAQPTIARSVTLAAWVHMLVEYLAQTPVHALDPRLPAELPVWAERHNDFVASRDGIEARCIVNERNDKGDRPTLMPLRT